MHRDIIEKLLAWKDSPDRKPLLLKGARQVGKTWVMKEFGRTAYKNMVYVDFYNNEVVRRFFEGDLRPSRILRDIGFWAGTEIRPRDTLVIFDEVQECNRALNSLKYFYEDANEYHIMAAGSFLGIALHKDESFPVGKTDGFTLYPMTFCEFLAAAGEERLVTVLRENNERLLDVYREELIKYLKFYFFVGGMPEAASAFCRGRDFNAVRSVQKRILSDYEDDFSKHAGTVSAEKTLRVWNSIPAQLSRQKKKFVYNEVTSGAKSRNYRSPLFWLSRCGLVYEVNRVSLPHYPLVSYIESDHFKLYMLDVGLLSAMCALDVSAFLEPDTAVFDHFRGALAEQYALQELTALGDVGVFYWAREGSGKAEVDFVLQWRDMVIPLEVKAALNLKAKSLGVFIDHYRPRAAIRASLAALNRNGAVFDIPLYQIAQFKAILEARE